MRHWRCEGPPLYIAAAAFLGITTGREIEPDLTGDELVNFLATFPGADTSS